MQLDAKNFGLAGGIISGLFMLVLALAVSFGGPGAGMIDQMSSLYVGFKPGVMGGLIGGLWGFVEGFMTFYLIAWVYDKLMAKSA